MALFATLYLDKEKDVIVDLYFEAGEMRYVLRTPNHSTGNLITNLARLCRLPLSRDDAGLLVIEGTVPCYVDGYNRTMYIFRLGDTKVANIFPDGTVEMKAQIPAISKTLMSQTKDYQLDEKRTIVKSYIRSECKFHGDLHTHMNAILRPDILIALGIVHQIRYPLYYIKKLGLSLSETQKQILAERRRQSEAQFADCGLEGKYLDRRIDDNTFLNFADLILGHPEGAAFNIPRIRRSLAVLKDGQAVFTNLEKVYLYRYVFTKGVPMPEEDRFRFSVEAMGQIPDREIAGLLRRMLADHENPAYQGNTLFQDKLLWIGRSYQAVGVQYTEISDTTLVKADGAAQMLSQAHAVMPAIYAETGVRIRFLAAIRRIPLTIVKGQAYSGDYFRESVQVLSAVADDPYVAGSDILGEEINDIRDLAPVIQEITVIAAAHPGFVIRIHAGENDGLPDNVYQSVQCVKKALSPGQPMPQIRIGHGLYTANLTSPRGGQLVALLKECGAVLEFQITSNVRLNNLSQMEHHPLRQYLSFDLPCVQGTDGGALYGTDSIDEQLSLEKMLNLSFDEMCKMRQAEEQVITRQEAVFAEKMAAWETATAGSRETEAPVQQGLQTAIDAALHNDVGLLPPDKRLHSEIVFAGLADEPLPEGLPVVLAGGSFNADNRYTFRTRGIDDTIETLLETADPKKIYFVIGHRLYGYEEYLVYLNNMRPPEKRFRIYAFVPSLISDYYARMLKKRKVKIRISPEPESMGLYKSIAYEVFKRRPSVLLAFDGNSLGANLIQEANNAKYPCRIYVNPHTRFLKNKALTLKGYVTILPKNYKEWIEHIDLS